MLRVNDKICGFTVQRVRYLDEMSLSLIEMIHNKTGAQLCWADSGEENKLFSVAFKTIPEDSTGVFHILEHSVLCGSERYPVREPFVELLKSSMNTFLNAMTFSDKTMFPVSSRNERDFLNLAGVYLDAVFAPGLLSDPNIFRQEGWHIEQSDEGNCYNGVVFNEMKGATSGVDGKTEFALCELMFPDNCYRFNSGGDPKCITDLTYERFCDAYRSFYHPSNARLFLDGDIPLEKTLSMIDQYLSRFEKADIDTEIPMQTPVSAEDTRYFETDKEDIEKRAVLAMGKIIGTWRDKCRIYAAQVLCDYLAETNESPLKKALLSSKLAEDMSLSVSTGTAQPYIMLTVRNLSDNNADDIKKLIWDTVKKICAEGLSTDRLNAFINQFSFSSRQMPEPKGLYRAVTAMASWLYGGDPMMYLTVNDAVELLREMVSSGGFESLLGEIFGDDGWAILHMIPSLTLGKEDAERESEKLNDYLLECTEKQLEKLRADQADLLTWQQTPDSPENLALLPTLPLSEVSDLPRDIPTSVSGSGEVTMLYHKLPTNGIVYITLYFPLTRFTLDELTRIIFLTSIYGELPTENYDVDKLQLAIKTYIGKLSVGIKCHAKDSEPDRCTPYLTVDVSALDENVDKALGIVFEILKNTKIDQKEKIRDIVRQADEAERQSAIFSGHMLGVYAVRAHYTACNAVREAIAGISETKYIRKLSDEFDSVFGESEELFRRVTDEVIGKAGLTVSITSTEPVDISRMIDMLPEGSPSPQSAQYKTDLPARLGIKIPAPISFAVKGYNLSRCPVDPDGSLFVAANIVSLSWLWNKVRVQGGAYGAGMEADRIGGIFCYSYRDPSPSKSLDAFDGSAQFLREFLESGEEELEKFIISAVASTDPLNTPKGQGSSADGWYFSGFTYEDRIRVRREMLAANENSLMRLCEALAAMANDGAVCVVGGEEALNDCGDLTVIEL